MFSVMHTTKIVCISQVSLYFLNHFGAEASIFWDNYVNTIPADTVGPKIIGCECMEWVAVLRQPRESSTKCLIMLI